MPSLVQKPWSSKDVTNNPTPLPLDTPSLSGALGNETDPLEIKEECVQCNGGKSLEDWDSYIPSFTKFMHNHRLHQVILLGTKCFLVSQKCRLEIPSHLSDGTDEDLRILPAPDPPIEQDDSNTMSVAVGNDFVEDTIFYQLQDIISKLDIKIRLCIRDSLIRLAQSATQRHYASDTNSTNKSSRDELEVEAVRSLEVVEKPGMPHWEGLKCCTLKQKIYRKVKQGMFTREFSLLLFSLFHVCVVLVLSMIHQQILIQIVSIPLVRRCHAHRTWGFLLFHGLHLLQRHISSPPLVPSTMRLKAPWPATLAQSPSSPFCERFFSNWFLSLINIHLVVDVFSVQNPVTSFS
ncbi:hypothetical protein LR48_Vigan03g054600 [Vigna angularis]|uniref:Uncharacterized protein n=1 Tax=Phaseolus angularis TaxID=3914 RepID=A0A0L9U301_PHAAN|nr:hypothetical protein LR48_Vigan03g054600 [Vigna angularis]